MKCIKCGKLSDDDIKRCSCGGSLVNSHADTIASISHGTLKSKTPNEVTTSMKWYLILGIIVMPHLFSWFTLRKGHTSQQRIFAFTWLIILMIVTIGHHNGNAIRNDFGTNQVYSTPIGLHNRGIRKEIRVRKGIGRFEIDRLLDQHASSSNQYSQVVLTVFEDGEYWPIAVDNCDGSPRIYQ